MLYDDVAHRPVTSGKGIMRERSVDDWDRRLGEPTFLDRYPAHTTRANVLTPMAGLDCQELLTRATEKRVVERGRILYSNADLAGRANWPTSVRAG